MIINKVILSSTHHKKYRDFWPIIAKAWRQLGVEPVLIYTSDDDFQYDNNYGQIIRICAKGVDPIFASQSVRLLAPCLFPDEICLISDLDMMPMSKPYFFDFIENIDDDKFVIYRPNVCGRNQIAMCYNAAKGSIWGRVFGVDTVEDIILKLQDWNTPEGNNWCMDQLLLRKYISKYQKNNANKVVELKPDDKYHRLDRSTITTVLIGNFFGNYAIPQKHLNRLLYILQKGNILTNLIAILPKRIVRNLYEAQVTSSKYTEGVPYSDFHMPTPYKKHKTLVDVVFESNFHTHPN